MKKTLITAILLTMVWGSLVAQEATSLQVAPSDQVIYPDASQILNKTELSPKPVTPTAPAPAAALATSKPLLASTPQKAASRPLPPAATKLPPSASGWYLRWTFGGEESQVRAWASKISGQVQVLPWEGGWEVLQGPLGPEALKQSLAGQSGFAALVRR